MSEKQSSLNAGSEDYEAKKIQLRFSLNDKIDTNDDNATMELINKQLQEKLQKILAEETANAVKTGGVGNNTVRKETVKLNIKTKIIEKHLDGKEISIKSFKLSSITENLQRSLNQTTKSPYQSTNSDKSRKLSPAKIDSNSPLNKINNDQQFKLDVKSHHSPTIKQWKRQSFKSMIQQKRFNRSNFDDHQDAVQFQSKSNARIAYNIFELFGIRSAYPRGKRSRPLSVPSFRNNYSHFMRNRRYHLGPRRRFSIKKRGRSYRKRVIRRSLRKNTPIKNSNINSTSTSFRTLNANELNDAKLP